MDPDLEKSQTIDDYISHFPEDVRKILEEIRYTILETIPETEEVISYRMPAFKFKGILVYFAAFKDHIGFFPTLSAIKAFRKELSGYEISKGTVRFPFGRQIPFPLIRKIVEFRVKENLAKMVKRTK